MTRDELARNVYIGVPLSRDVLIARAADWDAGLVTDKDVADCYAHADRMLADGEVPS